MNKILFIFFVSLFICFAANTQALESYAHKGEIGFSIGTGHYFGDLNPTLTFNHPKMAAAISYDKQFNNYIGMKIMGTYAFLGYSDLYSNNIVQRNRNLSFNTDVWEVTINGIFNFYRFMPGTEGYNFTPYVGLGIGAFAYDPYTFLNGQKYFLRAIGTEGQHSNLYPNLKPYGTIGVCFPLTLGMKYALNERMNIFGEFTYRFISTDYLDDVSGIYAPDAFKPDANGNPPIGYFLQDRSYQTGKSIGILGRQRGNSLQNDSYATFQVGISFNLQKYVCPSYSDY